MQPIAPVYVAASSGSDKKAAAPQPNHTEREGILYETQNCGTGDPCLLAVGLIVTPAILNSALLCATLFVGEQVGVPLEHAGRLVCLSATYKPSRPI